MLKSDFQAWEGFEGTKWKDEVNVRDFIQKNYTPYDGNEDFLADSSEATNLLWEELKGLQKKNAPEAAFWIWKPRLYLLLQLMDLAISMKK